MLNYTNKKTIRNHVTHSLEDSEEIRAQLEFMAKRFYPCKYKIRQPKEPDKDGRYHSHLTVKKL